MIEYNGKDWTIYCDKCDSIIEFVKSYEEAVEMLKYNGWQRWEDLDICPRHEVD